VKNEAAIRHVAALVYPGVTTTEIDAPVRAVAERLSADVTYVSTTGSNVVGVEPVRTVHADADIATDLTIDVLVVPGGLGWERLVGDADVMAWLRVAAIGARGVMAISTGSLLLAATGVLTGKEATGHWLARDALAAMGADVRPQRTAATNDHLLVTASGALAALELVEVFADRVRWGP
jgi:cyclohexyl-isocyanide hydratase